MVNKEIKPKYNMLQNTAFMICVAWKAKEKKVIILGILLAVITVALNVVNLYITPTILGLIENHVTWVELIKMIILFVILLMFFSGSSAYIKANVLYGRISVRSQIINMLNNKASLTSYPNLFDDSFKKLSIKAKEATRENSMAAEAIWTTLTNLLVNVLGFLIYIFLLSAIPPILMIMIIFSAFISYKIAHHFNEWRYHHREEEAEYERQMDYLSGCARDITIAKDIRIFGLKNWIEELYGKAMNAYISFQKKAQGVYIWSAIADLIIAFARNAIIYAYLINLVINGLIDISRFLLLFSAVNGFTEWISGILAELNVLHKQSLDISIIRECLEFAEPFKFEQGMHIKAEANKQYEIKLENVSFCYPGTERYVLKNINLTLHPKEKLAVVGLNGAGKSTLIKIISGFLDPTTGKVLLNGEDIKNFNRLDYYAMFSAVFQNFSLLAGTVAANVAQDDVDIDMEKVKKCIEKAGLKKKIKSLKHGYDTNMNRTVFEDAVLLSGGEMQRLMLARALYKDAPFILLDEPTAALDPIAESQMYQKYHEMTKEKSSIYISHRLASTRFCDRIILIDDGMIKEEGTHEELLKKNGEYAKLYAVQSKYYDDEKSEGEEDER